VELNLSRTLKRYRIELGLGLATIAISLYSLLSNSYNLVERGLTYPSLISYLSCFIITSYFLNRQNVKFPDRMLFSVLSTLAGIVLFEIVYYYSFGISQAELIKDFTFLGNGSGEGFFPLIWDLLIIAALIIGRKYMAMNKSLLVLIFVSGIIMALWIGIGYPQDDSGSKTSIEYGKFFDGIAKVIAVIPAFLFNKKSVHGLSSKRPDELSEEGMVN
jgi:hypothetical protein